VEAELGGRDRRSRAVRCRACGRLCCSYELANDRGAGLGSRLMKRAIDHLMSSLLGIASIGWFCVGDAAPRLWAQTSTTDRPLVHPLFSDNMVVQRGERVPIWGWVEPGTDVVVTLAGKKAKATADDQGRWEARLARLQAGGPYELRVAAGPLLVFTNVLIGDVWLCS
jgi:hypothetical protein